MEWNVGDRLKTTETGCFLPGKNEMGTVTAVRSGFGEVGITVKWDNGEHICGLGGPGSSWIPGEEEVVRVSTAADEEAGPKKIAVHVRDERESRAVQEEMFRRGWAWADSGKRIIDLHGHNAIAACIRMTKCNVGYFENGGYTIQTATKFLGRDIAIGAGAVVIEDRPYASQCPHCRATKGEDHAETCPARVFEPVRVDTAAIARIERDLAIEALRDCEPLTPEEKRATRGTAYGWGS